jgi:hypothetical protein
MALMMLACSSSALVVPTLRTATPRSVVKMQYGQQGYAQQPGYDAYQQGYAQQGFAQQVLWRVYPVAGVGGHSRFSGAVSALNQGRFGSVNQKYDQMPYELIANEERILCRWNMMQPVETVSRSQCKLTVYPDGNLVLTSQGSCAATLWRQYQGAPWNALYEGQSTYITDGCQVSLDANNPEGAVFACQQEMGGGGGGGGYGQQQQAGYPQQGGYTGY